MFKGGYTVIVKQLMNTRSGLANLMLNGLLDFQFTGCAGYKLGGKRRLIIVAALVALGGLMSVAEAALAQADLRVRVNRNLNFGKMVNLSGGEARIDAQSGTRTLTSGLVALNGNYRRARLTITGRPGSVYSISIPDRVVRSTAAEGEGKVTFKRFELSGPQSGVIGRRRRVNFFIGGTLDVEPSGASGRYLVSVPIFVEYQ